MTRRLWTSLALFALVLVPSPSPSAEDASKEDLAALKNAGVSTDAKGLMAYFQKRTISEETRTRIADLIRQLGADEFAEREKASKTLIEIGAPARPQLRDALSDPDLEIKRRAKRALEKIGPASVDATILPAAARVLAKSKTAGACELILNFLPSIEEPETAEEVAKVLASVALDKDGKPEAALLKGLSDKRAVKRWASADALARAALKTHKDDVVKLLEDKNVGVRRRVAVALVEVKDKAGVPALIKLLDSDSGDDVGMAEDVLMTIAGDKAPTPPEDLDKPGARAKYRKDWEGWWKEAGEKVDLAKVDMEGVGRGYTLVGAYGAGKARTTGRVMELDNHGKEKWAIEDINYPVYACKSKRDRILVCEYNMNRVTERDTKGKIYFTKNLNNQPIYCERLSNGNVFIVTRNQLLEVDRNGRDVHTVNRINDYILGACRHKDGTFTVVTNNQSCLKLDKDGKQTGSFSIGSIPNIIGLKCHFLPKGGVVIPDYQRNKIREYDSSGKLIVDIDAQRPTSVSKLSNGNYLFSSRSSNAIVEVNKDGKQMSSKTVPGTARTLLFVERK